MGSHLAAQTLSLLLAFAFVFGPAQTPKIAPESRDYRQKPDEVIKAMDLRSGQVIVDLGAGSGYFTRRFAIAVGSEGKAIGLEVNRNRVRDMTEDAKKLGLANYEARFVPEDDPQIAAASIDVLFLCDTYHHIENRVDYFGKTRTALRAGGRLIVIDFPPGEGDRGHGINKVQVIEELQRAGYKLTREHNLLEPRQFFLEFVVAGERRENTEHTE